MAVVFRTTLQARKRESMLVQVDRLHAALARAEDRIERLDRENTRLINENNRLWNKLGASAREAK